mmetsp:Transcript_25400/g.41406  ORF Transcript_25400/g.41406 Transcript_25400/m.41406 type:complete len:504 (+) Transcript_25400:79-1590(+)
MDSGVDQNADPINTVNPLKQINNDDLNGMVPVSKDEKDASDHEINDNDDSVEDEDEDYGTTDVMKQPRQVYTNGAGANHNEEQSTDEADHHDDVLRSSNHGHDSYARNHTQNGLGIDLALGSAFENESEHKFDESYAPRTYFQMYQQKVRDYDACQAQLRGFKATIRSRLELIRQECKQRDASVKHYQQRLNAATQERRRLEKDKQKAVKQKETDIKVLKAKSNEGKAELTRMKASVDKIRHDCELEKEQILRKCEKLEGEKQRLADRLEEQKTLLAQEREEKLKVKDNNQEYLRNAKQEIARQLEKEKQQSVRLETRVTTLEDEKKEIAQTLIQCQKELKTLEEREKRRNEEAEDAIRKKQEMQHKLVENREQLKQQSFSVKRNLAEVEGLKATVENQKKAIAQLNLSINKKSEKEKQFDEIRKKLQIRENKLDEQEKLLQSKIKSEKKRHKTSGASSKKVSRVIKEQIESKDPLHRYRNMLPFHWVSLILLLILMLAIAQK